MKFFLTFFLFELFLIQSGFSQEKGISVIEIVSSINGNSEEAQYFYENNWKKFREEALARKQISSFQIGISDPDSKGNIQINLITIYSNSDQLSQSEENFRAIINDLVPNGPQLLNDKIPSEFRKRDFLNEFSIK